MVDHYKGNQFFKEYTKVKSLTYFPLMTACDTEFAVGKPIGPTVVLLPEGIWKEKGCLFPVSPEFIAKDPLQLFFFLMDELPEQEPIAFEPSMVRGPIRVLRGGGFVEEARPNAVAQASLEIALNQIRGKLGVIRVHQ